MILGLVPYKKMLWRVSLATAENHTIVKVLTSFARFSLRTFPFATITLVTIDGSYKPLVGLRAYSVWVTAVGTRSVCVIDKEGTRTTLDRVWVYFVDPYLRFEGISSSVTVIILHSDPLVSLLPAYDKSLRRGGFNLASQRGPITYKALGDLAATPGKRVWHCSLCGQANGYVHVTCRHCEKRAWKIAGS